MATSIVRLRAETQEYDRKIQESKKKLKDFEQENKSASNILSDFAGKMGLSIAKFGLMSAAVAATSTAVKVLTDAFFKSESNIDEWGRILEGSKGAYDAFLQSIVNGDWSRFLDRLNAAVQGSRDLYDAMDRLGSIKANNVAAIALKQKNIQELRLRQQNGEDVSSELATATTELARLQSQEVTAGMEAGVIDMVNYLRNAGIDKSVAEALSKELIAGGQEAFDKYAAQYAELERSGTKAGGYKSRLGGLITYFDQGGFDINNLSEEEQTLYKIAKTITERETDLQKGISTYAQAVQMSASATREQNRNIKYVGKGTAGSSKVNAQEQINEGTISYYQSMISKLNKQVANEVDAGVRATLNNTIRIAQEEIERLKSGTSIWGTGQIQTVQDVQGVDMSSLQLNSEGLDLAVSNWQAYAKAVEATNAANKSAIGLFGQVAGAISQIDNPAAKIIGTIGQALATVALAYAETLAKDKTSKSNIYAFIAAAGAATVSMAVTMAAIKNNSRYANGGKIPGNRYSGDGQTVSVDAGELILNRAQQGNVASQLLSADGRGGGTLQASVEGDSLLFVINRALSKQGRGELVTTR